MRSISITQERSDEVNRNRGRTGGRNSKKVPFTRPRKYLSGIFATLRKAARAQILIDDTTVRGASMREADVVYFDDIILGCGSFEEPLNQGPVYLDEDPFVYGEGQFFLKQDCPLIGAGFGYIDEHRDLIGKTTDINSFPDSDIVDIGYHYPNWNYVNAGDGNTLSADLDDNMKVDFKDFAIFANYWQQSTSGKADLDDSGFVDYNDLAILAGQWLRAIEPDIQIQIYGDANDGFVEVGASGYSSDTQRIFLLADGQYTGEMFFFEQGQTLNIDISALGAGTHKLKVISVNTIGHVSCSNFTESTISCFLNYCLCPKAYEPNKPLYFYGFYSGENNISVKAFEYGEENPLWSEVYSGGDLSGFIPAEVTVANNIDYVEFKDTSTGMSAAKPVGSIFNPPEYTRAILILPYFWVNLANEGVIEAVKEAFRIREVPYYTLGCLLSSSKRIAFCAEKCHINYIYYAGHGDFIKNGVYRTHVGIDDGYLYSFKPSGVRGGFDLYKMGFDKVTFAFFDCCWTGHLVYKNNELVVGDEGFLPYPENIHNDMSRALRMESSGNHIFQGWYSPRPTGMLNYKGELRNKNPYHYFCLYEWAKLKEEKGSLYDALRYAIGEVNKLLYGEDARDNCRTRGQGSIGEVIID